MLEDQKQPHLLHEMEELGLCLKGGYTSFNYNSVWLGGGLPSHNSQSHWPTPDPARVLGNQVGGRLHYKEAAFAV